MAYMMWVICGLVLLKHKMVRDAARRQAIVGLGTVLWLGRPNNFLKDTLRVRVGASKLGPQDNRNNLELSWGHRNV